MLFVMAVVSFVAVVPSESEIANASTCAGVVEPSQKMPAAEALVGCAGGAEHLGAVSPTQPSNKLPNLVLTGVALALAATGIAYVRANERWRKERRVGSPRLDATAYVAGAALGVVIVGSLVAFHRPVGASGAFQNLAASLGRRMMPANSYWTVIAAGVTWQVWIILGVIAGAFTGAVTNRRFRIRTSPELGWKQAFGPSVPKRWIIAFLGAALVEFASAIAGGCTSGLALSGGIVLAPAAFLFMAAMFATGIPTALWAGRRERRGGS